MPPGAAGRTDEPKGASDTLGPAGATSACLTTSPSGRTGGLGGIGSGACGATPGDVGATFECAAGGTFRGSTRAVWGMGADGAATGGATGGVGRRPGANGGTRGGVALRGAPVGGVTRELDAPITGRSSRTGGFSPAPPLDADRAAAGLVVRLAASCGVAKSSVQLRAVVIEMIPPHTEHRARTPGPGTLAGSTRNTDWHSGHETFMTRRLG